MIFKKKLYFEIFFSSYFGNYFPGGLMSVKQGVVHIFQKNPLPVWGGGKDFFISGGKMKHRNSQKTVNPSHNFFSTFRQFRRLYTLCRQQIAQFEGKIYTYSAAEKFQFEGKIYTHSAAEKFQFKGKIYTHSAAEKF